MRRRNKLKERWLPLTLESWHVENGEEGARKLGKGVELVVRLELLAGAAKGERMANFMVKGQGMGTFHHRMNVAPSTGAKIPCDGHPWPRHIGHPPIHINGQQSFRLSNAKYNWGALH
jgi:hypothetical protein